jgi:hypothetical protein
MCANWSHIACVTNLTHQRGSDVLRGPAFPMCDIQDSQAWRGDLPLRRPVTPCRGVKGLARVFPFRHPFQRRTRPHNPALLSRLITPERDYP